ncbi:hypothetical protein [Commensalibacter nepenthis]|uniref:DUF2125 domain-containing protein n=1 Tax=Commensalibacter nepenthis TaxID=3043872 RepID=A0ABT6Q5P1_9PROT|nr:hypothetical protein [Commensalibacter sp. TBRC 10068]MDI2112219.1 hypothetical protein [Commensalibacter sp. TBRC 10068]
MNKKTTLFTLLGLIAISNLPSHTAHASQTWQSFCSNVTVNNSSSNSNSISATNYTVKDSNNPAIKMIAQQLNTTQTNQNLSTDQLQRITNITSTGILNLVLNHQMKDCNKRYYTDSLAPLLTTLQSGNKVNFTWDNIHIQNSKASYHAKHLTAQLSGQGNNIHITIKFSGLSTTSQHKTPTAFVPQQGTIDMTTTAQFYPLILAATSGNMDTAASGTFPVKINNLNVKNPQTTITANGDVTLNNKPTLTSANGILRLTNMQALITASNESKNSKLKTGLILAKFAGRRVGDNALEWDINWQGNLFKVNSVPIPVW